MKRPLQDGGIWAAVHTPFLDDFAMDERGLAGNVERFVDLGLAGIFFNGLFGEHWSMTVSERMRIAEICVSAADGKLGLSPNCTHHSLAETIELARHAADCGCDYVALMNPSSTPRTEAALYDWFCRAAEPVTVGVLIFNTPAPGYVLSPELVSRLAKTGLFVLLKEAGGADAAAEVRGRVGNELLVSDPSEAAWLDNLISHDQRLLYADPEPYLFQSVEDRPLERMLADYSRGDLNAASTIHGELSAYRRVYAQWVGEPIRRGHAACAALKHWAGRRGFASGPVRPPLGPLEARESALLDKALDSLPRRIQ